MQVCEIDSGLALHMHSGEERSSTCAWVISPCCVRACVRDSGLGLYLCSGDEPLLWVCE